VFIIYFLVLCLLIYKTGLFGLFKDNVLNPKFYLGAFILKCLGIAAFSFVYSRLYGGVNYLDSSNFFYDSKVIHDMAFWDFGEFTKTMFGIQDESRDTESFVKFISQTLVWDKDPEEFLYNDNRIIVRMHALIHFISFGNYYVHALFSVLISLAGINMIYKTFKFIFPGKEISLFLCWLVFPGLWFWTSGLFKEAPGLFLMGALLISLKRLIIDRNFRFKTILLLLIATAFSFVFKPYVLLPVLGLSALFFTVYSLNGIRKKSLFYIAFLVLFFILGNLFFHFSFGKDITALLANRQHTFVDMSKGGIFLLDTGKYVRLKYDYSLVDTSAGRNAVKINPGAAYVYWEHSHQKDTLYRTAGESPASTYTLHRTIPPANSTLNIPQLEPDWISFLKLSPQALYITLFKPLFFDARNAQDLLASFENTIIIVFICLLLIGGIKRGFNIPWLLYFLSISLLVLIIIGITSPNIGAIERYRSLVIPFILMAAVLHIKLDAFEPHPFLRFFKRPSPELN